MLNWQTATVDDETDEVLTGVGARLRALRQQRNGTLTQLSETTGISVSTLSRLESGQRKPTLELLLPLSRAYRVPLDELVGAPEVGDPRVHGTPVKRNGTTFVPLSRQPGGLQAFKMLIPDSKRPQRSAMGVHEGYEWVYVLSGRLRLLLGEHDLVLESGEVAEFDTRTPHSIGSAGGPVEVLALFGPQGERMHVRAAPRRAAAG
ncbi:XRE family transcriptional regulator [Angustibacter aerolatus]